MATCKFTDQLSSSLAAVTPDDDDHSTSTGAHDHGGLSHTHDHGLGGHSHDHLAVNSNGSSGTWTPLDHGHTHEHLEHAGEENVITTSFSCSNYAHAGMSTRQVC